MVSGGLAHPDFKQAAGLAKPMLLPVKKLNATRESSCEQPGSPIWK
jgi:hypothetical protein